LCLDADTGRLIWEKRFNVFHSDAPAHRVAWASPSVDPATGNVYAFGVAEHLHALDPTGKLLWERDLTEQFGAISTHGARTVSPVVEGELVIVSTLSSGWGDQARGMNRYFAFDKKDGSVVWISSPQPKHYDTNYSTPTVLTVDGRRLLVVGGSDGTFYGLEATTGRSIWQLEVSKRAILTSAAFRGTTLYLSHSEENLDTSEMGMVGALDASLSGTLKPDKLAWRSFGIQGGFASPVADSERLYLMDNGAVLMAFEQIGGAQRCLDTAVEFARGRYAFGRPIGSFQAIQHKLADLFVAIELARSNAYYGAWALSSQSDELPVAGGDEHPPAWRHVKVVHEAGQTVQGEVDREDPVHRAGRVHERHRARDPEPPIVEAVGLGPHDAAPSLGQAVEGLLAGAIAVVVQLPHPLPPATGQDAVLLEPDPVQLGRRPGAEDEPLEQRVARQPVGAMNARGRGLTGCVQSADRGSAIEIGEQPAHEVVSRRHDWYRLFGYVETLIQAVGIDGRKALAYVFCL